MVTVPPKDLILAFFLGLLTFAGTAVFFTIVYAIANIWLDGHNYTWHHRRFIIGNFNLGLYDILMMFFSSAAGLLTGVAIIKSRKR